MLGRLACVLSDDTDYSDSKDLSINRLLNLIRQASKSYYENASFVDSCLDSLIAPQCTHVFSPFSNGV